jgi:single-strand DNA-binding protein
MGRLTKDPELRRTGSGVPVASFTIAVDRDFADKQSGEKETDFFDVVAWKNTAEFVSKYFAKGRMAVVSGRLQVRKWKNKDGENRYSTEVVAENVYFGDSKPNSESNVIAPRFSAPAANEPTNFAILNDDDSELPF